MLHNNLGGQGTDGSKKSNVTGCEGKQQDDACSTAMGALAPKHTEPRGVGLPHRAPRRACAVIGNVFSIADSNKITTPQQGVEIDLHIKTRTDSDPYVAPSNNQLRDGAAGTPTFGEINLQGPDASGTRSVKLTFTFKRRDTGAEVEIPWMQFTLFDFDQIKADTSIESGYGNADGAKGQEVQPPPPPLHPTPTVNRAHRPVRDPNRSARQSRDSLITRCPAAAATSVPLQPR